MNTGIGIKTFYSFSSYNPVTGKSTPLSGKSENTILTAGLNAFVGVEDFFDWCHVGTDSTVPNASQTSLLSPVASDNQIVTQSFGAQSTPPYYAWKRKTFRIDGAAIANENLQEVGVGPDNTLGSGLISRALIRDLAGDPTSVTPLPGEMIDVEVEMRYYPPLTDVTGVVNLGGVNYNYIIRACLVADAEWGRYIGSRVYPISDSGWWRAYDDDIGAINEGPSGLGANSDTAGIISDAYVNNSFRLRVGKQDGGNSWVLSTGKLLRSLRIRTSAGIFQLQFDSQANPGFGIPKQSGDVMTPWFYISWGATP